MAAWCSSKGSPLIYIYPHVAFTSGSSTYRQELLTPTAAENPRSSQEADAALGVQGELQTPKKGLLTSHDPYQGQAGCCSISVVFASRGPSWDLGQHG